MKLRRIWWGWVMVFETQYLESAGIQLIDGDRGANYPKQEHFKTRGYCLFLSAKNVTNTGFAFEEMVFIDGDRDFLLRAGKLQKGDVVLTTRGTVGNVAFYGENIPFDHIRINSGMIIIRANPAIWNRRFLYFLFASSYVQEQISALTSGSAVPQLPARDIKKFTLPVIKKKTQDAIDKVVGGISEKIDLNRRINQTLEAMAQAIFKSWFVDFDPVKAKIAAKAEGRDPLRAAMSAISGKAEDELDALPPEQYEQLAATAALFPDEMVESELGEIPEGWHASTVGEQCAYLNRGISPKYVDEGGILVLNQKCIRDFSLDPSKGRRHDPNQRTVSGREIQLGDVLVNSTGVGTLGRVAQVLWLDQPAIVDSHVTVVRSGSKLNSAYLGQWFITNQPNIEAMGEGSTGQTELSRWKLANMLILVPVLTVLGAFSAAVAPMQSLIAARDRESRVLQEARDTLLPRLLSGELQPTVTLEGDEV